MDLLHVEGWRRAEDDGPQGATYRRPLGMTEYGFYWDTMFNGVAITTTHLELDAVKGLEDKLFSNENVEAAWLRLKQRYPLLGASTEQTADPERVEFVLSEERLQAIHPGEFNYLHDLNSAEDVAHFAEVMLNGPPVLDNTFLARVWAGPQTDIPGRYHIFIPVVHCITDGMGNATIAREFCRELTSLSGERRAPTPPLATRLRLLVPLEALAPSSKLNLPRRRWRLAIAKAVAGIRQAKMTGGHTLPARGAPSLGKPVRSLIQTLLFSLQQSKDIVSGCRALGITLGNALPVLSQVAISRVLHRLHRSGQITDEEWLQRRQEPMHFTGPVNYRPYLDSSWYAEAGAHEVMIAISFSALTLPFLPSSPAVDATGAPPPAALLSPARFLARVQMAKTRNQKLLGHPLMHEFHLLRLPERNKRSRLAALAWQAAKAGKAPPEGADVPRKAGEFSSVAPCVFTNGGASLGNRDLLLPREYPIPSAKGVPAPPIRLRLLSVTHNLRCRPGELYLGASTAQGRLSLFTCIDANTWDPSIILEWMNEVKAAALFYLGAVRPQEIETRPAKL